MILERFAYSPMGTFGKLIVGDLTLYCVEQPWRNNEPGRSCIPEGDYILEPHRSQKYPHTWAMVGETVSHYPEAGKPRSACLLHVGNTMEDVTGCIAPGTSLNENAWGVVSSRKAMEALREEMKAEALVLKITHFTA